MSRRGKNRSVDGPDGEGDGWLWSSVAITRPVASALALLGVVGACVYGLERLKDQVCSRPEYAPPVKIEIEVPPEAEWVEREGWRERIQTAIPPPDGSCWMDEELLPRLAEQVLNTGWVAEVTCVKQGMDGTVRVACAFRRPVAMILHEGAYFPVDEQGYRLPELYARVSDSGWIQIVGVESPAPEVGASYRTEDVDARAGVELASLIFRQRFAPRVGAIDVRNYGGRRDARREHILIWPRQGEPIIWGSAIGAECEETVVEDKLRMLAKHFQAGSPQARVDISVLPNAWIEQTSGAVRTADGSKPRE